MFLIILTAFILTSCTESVYEVVLKDLNGQSVSLGRFKNGKLVVYVWSGTCAGHAEDLKKLTRITPNLKGRVKLVSVAIMMDTEEVREILRKNGIVPNYPVLSDPDGELAKKVTILFLPATMVFNKEGIPEASYPGLPEDLISLVSPHK